MAIFQCTILGENFRWKEDDVVKLMGFYTTRWIEAVDEADAESKVVAALRQEPEMKKPDWYDDSGPNAKVYVEEIYELISGWDGKSGAGFVWFEEGT